MDFLKSILLIVFIFTNNVMSGKHSLPLVINTWAFTNGTAKAWDVINYKNGTALDAVEKGCSQCEIDQCDHTVGYGGSPDENGETTLDAMIMDGTSHDVGAVAALRRVKSAISVARKVLENTEHSLLVGVQATQFAVKMGFKEETLRTRFSFILWQKWNKNHCQPNFWKNVKPDPRKSCGPYQPSAQDHSEKEPKFGLHNHDTIGMIVIDENGKIAGGTSSNGAKFKIPGRVGDSPIPGSGAYVDGEVGGAAATGDGDVMMRFLPSYNAVENMRRGMNPTDAARDSIKRIIVKYPTFSGAIVVASVQGDYGAACHGMEKFPFSVANRKNGGVVVETVNCV